MFTYSILMHCTNVLNYTIKLLYSCITQLSQTEAKADAQSA